MDHSYCFYARCHSLGSGRKNTVLNLPEVQGLLHFDGDLPVFPPAPYPRYQCAPNTPLIRLNSGKIQYEERVLFESLNWQAQQGEHWAILGPNGCGKTSLLQLITGDNPQCYSNDLFYSACSAARAKVFGILKAHWFSVFFFTVGIPRQHQCTHYGYFWAV